VARLNRGTLAVKAKARRLVGVTDRGTRVGETHHRAKLTDADVEQIFALRTYGLSYRVIASKFDDIPGGISIRTVRDILTCRRRGIKPVRYKPCA
jgi:hypothetical protein